MGLNDKNKNILLFWIFGIISLLISISSFKLVDNDLLWHLKLGEDILANGISSVDKFSWQEGLHWFSQEWLFDIYIYGIVNLFGNLGFIISMAISYFAMMYISFTENKNYKSLVLFIIFVMSRNLFNQNLFNRPSIYSAIFIMLLIKVLLNDYSRLKKCISTILLSILIANIHGGCLVSCLLIIGIILVFDGLLILLNKNTIQNVLTDIFCLILFFISGLINPYGINIYEVGIKGPLLESCKFISEWDSVSFENFLEIFMVIFAILVIIAIVDSSDFKNLNRKCFLSLALTCAFLIGGLMSIRGLLIFSTILIIFDYKYFEEFIFKYLSKIDFLQKVKDFKMMNLLKEYIFVIVAVVSVILIIDNQNIFLLKENNFEKHIEENSIYSYNIIRYISENLNEDTKILNSYSTGNYMLYNDCKVLIDSRQHPFTVEFDGNNSLNDYLRIVSSNNYYKELMNFCEQYDIEYIFWSGEIDVGYDVLEDFQNDWEVILSDKVIGDNKKLEYYEFNQYLFKRCE